MPITYDDLVMSIPVFEESLVVFARDVIRTSTNRSHGDQGGIVVGNFIELKALLNEGKSLPLTDARLLATLISMAEVYEGELARRNAGNLTDPVLNSVIKTKEELITTLQTS